MNARRDRSLQQLGLSTMALLVLAVSPGIAADPAAPLAGTRPTIDAAGYPSLQAAIDALPAAGGLVRLPVGEFVIEHPLRITGGDVHLEGSGPGTHIHNANTTGAPALALVPSEPFDRAAPSNQRTNRWRIQISNLRLTGNPQSGHGIDALWVDEIFVHGVTISEHGGDGIRLDHCYEDPRINDCLITYNKQTGLNLLGCHDIVVSGNQFEENQDALRCADGFNLCMSGNNLDDHLRHGVVIENTYGSVVAGNMIEECQETAILLDRDCYGITLSANVIAHNGQGVDLVDAHGCAVSANTFTLLRTQALRIGPLSGRIAVSGNNFSNSYIGDGRVKRGTDDQLAAGLVLEGTSDVSITGNVFSGLSGKAVTITGPPSQRIVFQANVIVDAESDHADLRGVVSGNVTSPE
jgi:parallel beta-helix repeat protein